MRPLPALKRVVVKIGTGTLTDKAGGLHLPTLRHLAAQILMLHQRGIKVTVVSSGAVGLGMSRLGLNSRPKALQRLQACAAVGQSLLTETWQKVFSKHQLNAAQLLFTREDLGDRKRHLAARETLETLWSEGVIPVINENDSISAAEIKFGDNDVLSALVSGMLGADLLVILTSVDGLIAPDTGSVVSVVSAITPEVRSWAGETTSSTAVGGMITKLEAAHIATRSGTAVLIGNGRRRGLLEDLLQGKLPGTFFPPAETALRSRRRWLAFFQKAAGTILVDTGAAEAINGQPSSLLAKGIIRAEGEFSIHALVDLANAEGKVFARGTTRFSSFHIKRIAGKSSAEVKELVPNSRNGVVVHRDSLVLL